MKATYFKHESAIIENGAEIGKGTKVWHHSHVRSGSKIGAGCNIGKNCYIDKGAVIGSRVKLQNNVSVWRGVELEDDVFVGPNVTFTNDLYPRAFIWNDERVAVTRVKRGASLGANSTIVCGNREIGQYAMVGAGAVVTKDVPPHALVVGNPAHLVGYVCKCGARLRSRVEETTTHIIYKCEKCGGSTKIMKPGGVIGYASPYIGEEEIQMVSEVLRSGMLAQGPKVKQFEQSFATLCGVKHAVAVNSGTAALHCALYALGIGPGDEVITVPFTFAATANSILMQGARPVFVDIREDTFNIAPEKVEAAITTKTKAIIPVNLYGQPADYKKLREIALKHNLRIVEDAAQSVNSSYMGTKSGALGDISAFSFYATKNLITGEGGMVTTNNAEWAERVRCFRHHGQSEQTRYEYYDLGYNYRMTDIMAAIGLVQMERLSTLTEARQRNAKFLDKALNGIKGIIPPVAEQDRTHVYHQYTIRVTSEFPMTRDELNSYLRKNGFVCGIFYPKPLHLHPHFARLGYKVGDFPVSEKLAKEVLSLPVHPKVGIQELERLVALIKAV